jgi:hypothetical protein
MTTFIQLTEQLNPLAQIFRVTEPGGSVITAIGIFFQRAPEVGDDQFDITLELRPVSEGGNPSSQRYIEGTRASASAVNVRAAVNASGGASGIDGTFNANAEYKFTFPDPVFFPYNTEVAIVISTAAPAGKYKVWSGVVGDFVYGSTAKKVTEHLNAGGFYQSANGTSWVTEPYTDLAFKVYRAVFQATGNYATLTADPPPVKALTDPNNIYKDNLIRYSYDPLLFTGGNNQVRVIHPASGFIAGDRVVLSSLSTGFSGIDTINGVLGSSILGTRLIDSADLYGYTITMDSAADSSVRAGGTGLLASEQYIFNTLNINIPVSIPEYTAVYTQVDLTTITSYGTEESVEPTYQELTGVPMLLNSPTTFIKPFVIASVEQEDSAGAGGRLGSESTTIRIGLNTDNKYVAPYFNHKAANLQMLMNFIDNQDSDDYNGSEYRNVITTIDYQPESSPNGGSAAAKHLTVPFVLAREATSLRVIVDAARPKGAEFSVWYRTNTSASDTKITDVSWTEFSKTDVNSKGTAYVQIQQDDNPGQLREYEFNVYDIPSYDEYQVKIVMTASRSSYPPIFTNLRTIASV